MHLKILKSFRMFFLFGFCRTPKNTNIRMLKEVHKHEQVFRTNQLLHNLTSEKL